MFGSREQAIGKAPFPEPDTKEEGTVGQLGQQKKTSGLLKEASWIRPADVTKVLYATQVLPAMTLQKIVSSIPGPVRLVVTRNVRDRWHTRTLIPQNSLLLAEQTGTPGFGESRLAITVQQIHFPDGVVLDLGKGRSWGIRAARRGSLAPWITIYQVCCSRLV
jgi:type IV secretory pathway VirB10-like protein